MESIVKLRIGEVAVVDGVKIDKTRPVEFTAERLGELEEVTTYGSGHKEILYRAEDGRLIVFVGDWSPYGTWTALEPIEPGDLDVNGRYELLARAAGLLTRPLTLDEALAKSE